MSVITRDRILELLNYLNHGLVERDGTLKLALLTMLAGENLLLVGPPGTAKSLIARKLAKCLAQGDDNTQASNYFEYLLTKFSTPEEIFGPLSITALKADQFKRNTAGYLPSVRLAFLDEIFKASSSILNALLTILNERIYHNGTEALPVPLQSLIAASNELPTEKDELDALYDRFLVRSYVGYVSDDNLSQLLEKPGPEPSLYPLSQDEIVAIRQGAEDVVLSEKVLAALRQIWTGHRQLFKEDPREHLSDRRLMKAVNLLRVAALSNGRAEVDLSDLLLLRDCLWNHRDNAVKVSNLIVGVMEAFNEAAPVSEHDSSPVTSYQAIVHSPSAKFGTVIKGYKGSGTEQDPILIESIHDLAGLERKDIGTRQYWFRQTANIDCRELTTWLKIDFCGNYDGGGYSIEYESNKWVALFENVKKKSVVRNLQLKGLGLATKIVDSEIFNCASDMKLAGHAIGSQIMACESGAALMEGAQRSTVSHCASEYVLFERDASKCEIRNCRSQHVLVSSAAVDCTIYDCEVRVNGEWEYNLSDMPVGGIAQKIDGGHVFNCFVSGQATSFNAVSFSAITWKSINCRISHCALGRFSFVDNVKRSQGRLVSELAGASKLENNVALDTHPGKSDANGQDGETVAAKLFTQHYFEHRLDWDFENIWEWSDGDSKPKLRAVGIGSTHTQKPSENSCNSARDQLGLQLSANIWLESGNG